MSSAAAAVSGTGENAGTDILRRIVVTKNQRTLACARVNLRPGANLVESALMAHFNLDPLTTCGVELIWYAGCRTKTMRMELLRASAIYARLQGCKALLLNPADGYREYERYGYRAVSIQVQPNVHRTQYFCMLAPLSDQIHKRVGLSSGARRKGLSVFLEPQSH